MQRWLAAGLAALWLTAAPAFPGERTVTLTVDNMTCAACPFIVQKALARVSGVTHVAFPHSFREHVVQQEERSGWIGSSTTNIR